MTPTYTHMPFLFSQNGNDYMLFGGQVPNGEWKLYWSLLNVWSPQRFVTGAPASATECAPAAFVENGVIRMSALIEYRLHQFEGYSLDAMKVVAKDEKQYFSGVVTPFNILRANSDFVEVYDRLNNPLRHIDMLRFGFEYMRLVRLSFVPLDPDKILVTGNSLMLGQRSVLYSMSQDKAWLIQVAGQNVYKCALTGAALYYVTGPDMQRVIVGTNEFDLIPL